MIPTIGSGSLPARCSTEDRTEGALGPFSAVLCRTVPNPMKDALLRLLLLFAAGVFLWPLGGMVVLWLITISQLISLVAVGALPLGLIWLAVAKRRRSPPL
jgi:hypothetical protein